MDQILKSQSMKATTRPQNVNKLLKSIIYFWATCDTIVILFLLIGWFTNNEIPFYSAIVFTIDTIKTSGDWLEILSTILLLIIESSLYFSAFYLFKQNKFAAYICYFQAPIRWFVGYSSIPLLHKIYELHIVSMPVATSIITFIELTKLLTIFLWHRNILKTKN